MEAFRDRFPLGASAERVPGKVYHDRHGDETGTLSPFWGILTRTPLESPEKMTIP